MEVETVERLGLCDRTMFVVDGDHDAVALHTTLCPNVWLREPRVDAHAAEAPADVDVSGASSLASCGSAFLRPHPTGMGDPASVASGVRAILSTLSVALRASFRIVERAELDALGADAEALLALAAVPGVASLSMSEGAAVRWMQGAGHGYHPDVLDMTTGFVPAGAGGRPEAVVPLLPFEHVALMVAALLGVSLPACDGMLFPGLMLDRSREDYG